ncbi:hypothetical protein GQ457_15G024340 [Hibiscus cannabinus]
MSSPTGSSGGRVTRPVRRRTRASRRVPPFLVSTDVENFRAMVQHFTAGPCASAPPVPGPHMGEPSLGFGFGERQPYGDPGNSLMVPPADLSHLQYQQQQQQQQQQQMLSQFQHQNQAYMFSMNNYNPGAGSFPFKDMGEP